MELDHLQFNSAENMRWSSRFVGSCSQGMASLLAEAQDREGFARRFKLSDFAHFLPNTDPVVGLGPSSTQTFDAENMRWSQRFVDLFFQRQSVLPGIQITKEREKHRFKQQLFHSFKYIYLQIQKQIRKEREILIIHLLHRLVSKDLFHLGT